MKHERLFAIFLAMAVMNIGVYGIFFDDWRMVLMMVCANASALALAALFGAGNK